MARVDGVALGCLSAGIVIGYAGIKGYSIPQTIQDIVTGKSPLKQAQVNQIVPSGIGAGLSGGTVIPGASATGEAIAQDALHYQGVNYVWAGATPDGWDCSGMANYVIGHDEGMAIPGYPGGTFTGASHGPSTIVWLAWSGCTTIGHSGAAAAAGDLCVWQTHMGIALGGGQMISAQTPASGTQVSGIDGFIPGELLFVRRLNAALATPPGTH